ncbi:MAG: alpha-amylase family glycosyl hydrolase [Breznakibacter sp.]
MNQLPLIQKDPWLAPFSAFVESRFRRFVSKLDSINDIYGSLANFASGHLRMGLHPCQGGWIFREWAPNATQIFLIGDFSGWREQPQFALERKDHGHWEIFIDANVLHQGDLYQLSMHWHGGNGIRIPSYANRVVQDPDTLIFTAQVWAPDEPYLWRDDSYQTSTGQRLIYEAHVGMSSEEERVATFDHFREKVLPHIHSLGYNTIQLMAIQEHPYYGSFGYHVSNFFAVSSRFGTPDDLKRLVDEAHQLGIAVIMDIVHSHAVKNETEGLSRFDGSYDLYFHGGARGEHPAWDSRCFNYGKDEVVHFLLSNIRYWLEEYHFDGFRFDGVTSMLYLDHGLGKNFVTYSDYFTGAEDEEALLYLTLANRLIYDINPNAISIAEEMSGFPGIAGPIDDGGVGFNYRLSMGVPDYWIKLIKEVPDEQWPVGQIYHELIQHRPEEQTISYAESHDQALVGDQTIIFRLLEKEMYYAMDKHSQNLLIDRGMALHKMIRLVTLFTASGGYLTFMGNEFGHPEWIDFPREGNQWSYKHARRLWHLAFDQDLRYHWLLDFDKAMMAVFNQQPLIGGLTWLCTANDSDQVLAFMRGEYLVVFNFNPMHSFTDYGIPIPKGKYSVVLSTDEGRFGGFNRVDMSYVYYSQHIPYEKDKHMVKLYLPARSGMVFCKKDIPRLR